MCVHGFRVSASLFVLFFVLRGNQDIFLTQGFLSDLSFQWISTMLMLIVVVEFLTAFCFWVLVPGASLRPHLLFFRL